MSHKIITTPETKRCPQCGKVLPASSFRTRSNGILLQSYCRDCNNRLNRTKYRKPKSMHGTGEVFRKKDGRLWEYTHAHWRRHWSRQMLDDLRRYYSKMTNQELADILDVTLGTLNRKAQELGLHKTRQYIADIARQHLVIARAESAIHGNPGQIKPGEHRGKATEFKKKGC